MQAERMALPRVTEEKEKGTKTKVQSLPQGFESSNVRAAELPN